MTQVDGDTIDLWAERARDGDRDAFGRIVKAQMNQVAALTYRMTGDRQTAMDLAQDAFIAAWTKIKQFRGEAKFTSWLYRIATNTTLNYLRRTSSQHEVLLENGETSTARAGSASEPDAVLQQSQLREAILGFMKQLPPQQRAVFELRFYQEVSFEEISNTLGKALGTVKTHYRQAVLKLRDWAEEEGWKP
jgi:RNA polymerase sigma-70 factor (ECF subfamily)